MPKRIGRRYPQLPGDAVYGLLALSVPLVLYVCTLAPTVYVSTVTTGVLNGDPAEYQLVTNVLGVAHPTGYPLYTMLGFLFAHAMPIGDPAYRINLLSALAASGALAMLFVLLRKLYVAPSIALLSVLALAVSTAFWDYATIAQTYALNGLLLGFVLFRFLQWSRAPSAQNLAWLAFAYGLSLTHHSTMLLVAPAMVLAIGILHWRVVLDWRQVLAALGAFALPLLLYLYIPVRGSALLNDPALAGAILGIPRVVVDGLVTPHYLAGASNVVLGSFYAPALAANGDYDVLNALGGYVALLVRQFSWLGVALAIAGLIALARQARALVVLVALAWLSDVLVVSRAMAAYGEGPELYTPTWLLAALCIGVGSNAIASRVNIFSVPVRTHLVWLALLVVIAASVLANGASMWARRTDDRYRQFAQRTLSADLPRESMILGAWPQVTPLHYAQVIEGARRDVAVIHTALPAPEGRALIAAALDENRPLFLLDAHDELVAVPLRSPPVPAHTTDASFRRELSLLGYTVRGQSLELYWRADTSPRADYRVFVHLIGERGEQINTPDQSPASEYFPTSLWRAGQTFRDVHLLPVLDDVNSAEVGLYDPATGKRLALPDGSTTLRITLR